MSTNELAQMIGQYLAGAGEDFATGPFSDTPYVRAELEEDGMLSLFTSHYASAWPDASFDVHQFAEWLSQSGALAAVALEVTA